jgi:hypothetical protein
MSPEEGLEEENAMLHQRIAYLEEMTDYIHPLDLVKMLRQWATDVEDAFAGQCNAEAWKELCADAAWLLNHAPLDQRHDEDWGHKMDAWTVKARKWGIET